MWLNWQLLGTSNTFQYTVNKMQEGSTVQFRVKAVNETGVSKPSEPSDIVKFEDPF